MLARKHINRAMKALVDIGKIESDQEQVEAAFRAGWFENVWKLYPRKTAKQAAKAAFLRHVRKEETATLMVQAATNFKDYWDIRPKSDHQYIPYMQKWVNQGQWKDWVKGMPEYNENKWGFLNE